MDNKELWDEIDRLKQENERLNDIVNTFKVSESSSIKYKDEQIIKLQQNQAKLIEALKPFVDNGDVVSLVCDEDVNKYFFKASQTMKEVCGEEKKEGD